MKSGAAENFTSTLETFSVKIGRHWTTVRLEPEMMEALRDIALAVGISVHELCTEIAVDCFDGSFTSALRVFVLDYYRGIGPKDLKQRDPVSAVLPDLLRRQHPDWMHCSPIALEAKEAAPQLAKFYGWWKEKRAGGSRLPSEIDPRVIKDLGLGGFVHVVEATAADPMNYRYRLWASRVNLMGASSFSGRRVADLPGPDYRDTVAAAYFSAATSGCPRFQQVVASVNGSRRVYQRLIVPFAGDDGKPDRLLVAVSYQPADLFG